LFVSHTVSVSIPEISAPCLNSLPLLIPQDGLHDVFISILASLFKFVLDAVGNILTQWIEITWWGLLLGDQLLFKDSFDDFPSF
jgi:hypothetical protein